MKDNLDKVLERDQNLTQLQNRAGMFNTTKKKYIYIYILFQILF
jgi:hypothetical protein